MKLLATLMIAACIAVCGQQPGFRGCETVPLELPLQTAGIQESEEGNGNEGAGEAQPKAIEIPADMLKWFRTIALPMERNTRKGWLTRAEQVWEAVEPVARATAQKILVERKLPFEVAITPDQLWKCYLLTGRADQRAFKYCHEVIQGNVDSAKEAFHTWFGEGLNLYLSTLEAEYLLEQDAR